jgi:hypothetical protein
MWVLSIIPMVVRYHKIHTSEKYLVVIPRDIFYVRVKKFALAWQVLLPLKSIKAALLSSLYYGLFSSQCFAQDLKIQRSSFFSSPRPLQNINVQWQLLALRF